MKHEVLSTPPDHLIAILDHALAEARQAGLLEVTFIVELAIAATVEAAGERSTSYRAAEV